ncbi:MAG: phosphate/phosphite/phosphonate ABC transporter substrate-binding protein [Nitrospirae bacterium]|nr:phosphate/phosphite/phosphonate ABC transporter substrate-binding protein [Nitrospirota bacterium]
MGLEGKNVWLAACAAVVLLLAGAWLLLFGSRGSEVALDEAAHEAAPVAADSRPVLRVAVSAMISPSATRQYYNDVLNVIGDKVGRRVEFIQRKTYAEVNALVEDREVDLAFVCSGPYVDGHKRFGMEMLAVPVSHGEKVYYSYVIVPKDSRAASLKDLRGRTFAFTDPSSNTGCLVPTYMLARMGETPSSFFGHTFFSNSHDNSIKAVAEGQADGASVDSLIWEFMKAEDDPYVARTRVIDKSPPYGIPPVVVHPDLDPALKAGLKDALLSLDKDVRARPYLDSLKIERFVPGDDGSYDSVREMDRWLKKKGSPE